MSDPTVPLTVISNPNTQYPWASIAIGTNVMQKQLPPGPGNYWFVVIDRSSLAVVYNQVQTSGTTAPPLGNYNSSNYILIVATLSVGLNQQPQGDLFNFLDLNGAGRQLRRVDQIATQIGCGTLGTFGYALVGVLGNMNVPGFEGSNVASNSLGPILTVQLMPTVIGGATVYTPVELSDA
jgi:hypothetical protein